MGGRPSSVNKHERLQVARDYYMTIVRIIDAIDSGLNETEACEINHMDKNEFRNATLYRRKWANGLSDKELRAALEEPFHKLYRHVLAITSPLTDAQIASLPPDFNETMTSVVKSLGGREGELIKLYLFEEMTFQDIGKLWDLTDARIGQIYARSLRILRRPMYKNRIYYGDKFLAERKRISIEEYNKRVDEMQKEIGMNIDDKLKELRSELKIPEDERPDPVPTDPLYIELWRYIPEGLTVRAVNCLMRRGFRTLPEIDGVTYSYLARTRGMGYRTLANIIIFCKEHEINLVNDFSSKEYAHVKKYLEESNDSTTSI